MAATLAAAIGMVLILEGMLPFASPGAWRQAMQRAAELSDAQLRTFGLVAMIAGVGIVAITL